MKRYNVTKYGVIPNIDELQTEKIQNLINSLDEGGEIYFPKGTYNLSTIFLRDNITINIAKGAKILGPLDFNEYAKLEPVDFKRYQDVSHSYFNCSLFVAKNCNNITFKGRGIVDLRSVWDEENINDMVHRGAKIIALKECNNVLIENLDLRYATDLAVYFTYCKNVIVRGIKLKVYIDGISPDNCKNVLIENCHVISGDDGIVFKSSYNLNRLEVMDGCIVRNCLVQSRCNALKFGTESNGGFKNIHIENIKIKNTRISGIAIESVDGAHIDNLTFNNIEMENVIAPIFIHLGDRLRGPEGSEVGSISNIKISNLTSKGPYVPYKTVAWNYVSFKNNDLVQYPWSLNYLTDKKELKALENTPWQFTCNVCGFMDKRIKYITLENITLELNGGVKEYNREVPERGLEYPEVFTYGTILPASGIYFRHIENLKIKNFKLTTIKEDSRPPLCFDDVINSTIE